VLFVPDEFIRTVLLENRITTGSPDDFNRQDSLFAIRPDKRLPAYFHSFLSYLTASDKPDDSLLELKFRELIMMTASPTFSKSYSGYLSLLCNTGNLSLREIMEENYIYPISLKEYARLCGRSLSAFKRDFKETYQTTPGQWLREKRLQHSKHLLLHTDKPVTEILFESGFKNTSHFSRIFKERFDTSPLQFRKLTHEAKG
jgi:AraC family transcriptional regulator, exoenzyme S synthesis regulatory protein ExsA